VSAEKPISWIGFFCVLFPSWLKVSHSVVDAAWRALLARSAKSVFFAESGRVGVVEDIFQLVRQQFGLQGDQLLTPVHHGDV
jgi:hypothetical protein